MSEIHKSKLVKILKDINANCAIINDTRDLLEVVKKSPINTKLKKDVSKGVKDLRQCYKKLSAIKAELKELFD